jgi:hypothetical protein
MATKLEKPLKGEGKRQGQAFAWQARPSDVAALAVAFNASLQK